MAVSPMIPTSFVPRQPDASLRAQRSGANLFLILSLAVLGIALIGSGGIFAYQKYLESVANAKSAKLADAEKRINEGTVKAFVRLRDRLSASKGILAKHVAVSRFMTTLEGATLSTVSFDDMKVTVADDRTASVTMTGSAKSFNSLAAQSAALANVPTIQHALFSDFKINKDNSVSFTLAFDADSSLLIAGAAAAAPVTSAPPAATSTPAKAVTPPAAKPAAPTAPATPAAPTAPASTAPQASPTAPTTPATPPAGSATPPPTI